MGPNPIIENNCGVQKTMNMEDGHVCEYDITVSSDMIMSLTNFYLVIFMKVSTRGGVLKIFITLSYHPF